MKIQTVIYACIALALSGCASNSSTYRHDIAYEDGSYGNGGYDDSSVAYQQDDGYYDSDVAGYYDSSDDYYYDDGYYDGDYYGRGFYGGSFSLSFGYGGNYGYCSPFETFCGYNGWSNYGYGYGWPWGYPYNGYGHGWYPHDEGHDHHHHHHQPDPPATTGEPGPGRLFLTPRPRKGVYRPNAMPDPQPQVQSGNDVGDNGRPRGRRDDGSDGQPPMRWRPPVTVAPPSGNPRSRMRAPDAPPVNRPEPTVQTDAPVDRPSRSDSTPDPRPAVGRDQDNDRPARNRVRDDGGGR